MARFSWFFPGVPSVVSDINSLLAGPVYLLHLHFAPSMINHNSRLLIQGVCLFRTKNIPEKHIEVNNLASVNQRMRMAVRLWMLLSSCLNFQSSNHIFLFSIPNALLQTSFFIYIDMITDTAPLKRLEKVMHNTLHCIQVRLVTWKTV